MEDLKMKGWLMMLLGVLAILSLSSGPTWAKEQEIKIGTLIPLTGSLSALGINAKYGCDMAAAEEWGF